MVNWFYVVGSERVGPVSDVMLKGLLNSGEINGETYVWKKGFTGWERVKDVAELTHSESTAAPTMAVPSDELEEEETSPEVDFIFDWGKIRENDELFYIKIGHDRKKFSGTDIFGPYSLVELREALSDHRINGQTQIFAPGMDSWIKIRATPAQAGLMGTGYDEEVSLEEAPLLLVLNHSPLPLVTLVKKSGIKEISILGAGPFKEYLGQSVMASLYVGSEIRARNLKLRINHYDLKMQLIECAVEGIDQDARNLMLGHAV